jgi:hypothetical protein
LGYIWYHSTEQLNTMAYKFNPFTSNFDAVGAGTPGPAGPQGPTGATGPAGVVAATAPISYNSGTQTVSTSMATSRLLGRTSAGTGVAEEISVGSGLSLSGGTLSSTGSSSTLLYRLNSTVAGANVTSSQSIFGVGVTLDASTVYAFSLSARFNKTAGTTSHNFQLSFGGNATFNNALVHIISEVSNGVTANTGSTSASYSMVGDLVTARSIEFAITNATQTVAFYATGTVSVANGGTFIPQYSLTAAPGGAYTTQIGSFIELTPIGASGSNNSVGTWA